MKKLLKKKRNTKFRSDTKKSQNKLFIKDIKNAKFKKRRNKKVLKFLQRFDLKIDKNNAIYLYAGGALLLLGVLSFAVFSPYFQIKTINIIRQDNLSNINIAYKSLENIRNTHIMQNDEKSIEGLIKNYQENIESVGVSRVFPDELDIVIGSYTPVFNTMMNNKSYIVTENGSFVPKEPDPQLKNLTIISSKRGSSIPDYKKIIDLEYINQISSLYNEIKTNLIRIQIRDITYYPIERELIITIESGNKLIFDLEKAIIPQVKRLAIFDTENIKIDEPTIIYIDLRITDKVFYCTTETEYQCVINLKNIYPENPVIE